MVHRALPLLFVLAGCLPKAHLEVLEPAEVALPAHVRSLAVVDRSRARNVGQGVIGVLEGAVTGEAIGADTEGRKAATGSIVAVLAESPRFEVVQPAVTDRKALESTLFAKVLDHRTLVELCESWGVDGVVALEAFDSDSVVHADREEDSDGDVTWTAERTTSVLTAWRVYDRSQTALLDDLREQRVADTWRERGDTEEEALEQLPSQVATVASVGAAAGDAYGRRIAPNYVMVARAYYGGGHPALKAGKLAVKRADWSAAVSHWEELLDDPDPKLAGKAHYNIAVALEVEGRLKKAVDHADRADELLGKGRTRRYAAELRARRVRKAEVRDQMSAPAPEPPAAPAPAAAPSEAPLDNEVRLNVIREERAPEEPEVSAPEEREVSAPEEREVTPPE